MLKTKVEVEEDQGAPAITPDLLSKLKKQDMTRQLWSASASTKKSRPRTAVPSRER